MTGAVTAKLAGKAGRCNASNRGKPGFSVGSQELGVSPKFDLAVHGEPLVDDNTASIVVTMAGGRPYYTRQRDAPRVTFTGGTFEIATQLVSTPDRRTIDIKGSINCPLAAVQRAP